MLTAPPPHGIKRLSMTFTLVWLLVLKKWKFFNGHLNPANTTTSALRWTLPVTPFLDAVQTDGAVGSEQDDHVPEDVEQQSV